MEIDLSGKMAVISGSTEGIGLACARGILGAGGNVTINGRKPEVVEAVSARLRTDFPGREVVGIAADLGSAVGCEALIAGMPECDILINNVGVVARDDALEASDETYLRLYELNLLSSVRLSRAYMPGMLERNQGRVIFSGAQRPIMAYKGGTAYSASKMAQLSFARSLAERTRGTAVTVNTVLIGVTHSASLDSVAEELAAAKGRTAEEDEADFIDMVSPQSLLRRLARAEEVANFVVYLASPFASATNGAVLSAEGGTRGAIY
ncbi:MAG: SDR family oxidoreductase [Sphingomonadales bacterium]|nr:SDR family oxidoreductase [Sphingomonadales bacterium]